jgi:hypothetical protein
MFSKVAGLEGWDSIPGKGICSLFVTTSRLTLEPIQWEQRALSSEVKSARAWIWTPFRAEVWNMGKITSTKTIRLDAVMLMHRVKSNTHWSYLEVGRPLGFYLSFVIPKLSEVFCLHPLFQHVPTTVIFSSICSLSIHKILIPFWVSQS